MKIQSREDIQVGDVITHQFVDDGVLVTRVDEVTSVGALGFHTKAGRSITRDPANSRYAIFDIVRPTPPLPTEPGTVIDAEVNIPGVCGTRRLLRTDRPDACAYWVTATGTGNLFRWFGDFDIKSWTLVASA